jgi:hypothetical protein
MQCLEPVGRPTLGWVPERRRLPRSAKASEVGTDGLVGH